MNDGSVIPDDYTNPTNGLLYCGQCHTPKQCRVRVFGRERLIHCSCSCKLEQWKEEEAERIRRERLAYIQRLKASALQDKALWAYTFDRDNGSNPAMPYVRSYAEHWRSMREKGTGLLMWGGIGSGKTFAAACIAHAVTEQGYPVLMTNFGRILNSLSGMFSEDKNHYLASLNEFDLLIIDDLGIERSSGYAMEQVYHVVDNRYLSGLPFIITTNLTLDEMKAPMDLAHARIYDRILERCMPVCFTAANFRRAISDAQRQDSIRLLSEASRLEQQRKEVNQ